MRVGFAGTLEFASTALVAHCWRRVLPCPWCSPNPDRPGRARPAVVSLGREQTAIAHAIPVAQPRSLRWMATTQTRPKRAKPPVQAAQLDVLVVAAYGLLLPQWALDLPRLGCLNIHASLLPRWRGAAPIHRAIEAGDAHTGVTIMQMDAGLNTGAMCLVERLPIAPDDHRQSARQTGRAGGPR